MSELFSIKMRIFLTVYTLEKQVLITLIVPWY